MDEHYEQIYALNLFQKYELDVLDDNLYSYDNVVFNLTSSVKEKTVESLYDKILNYLDTVPALGKAADELKDKVEYTPRMDFLSAEVKKAIKEGLVEFVPAKKHDDSIYLQLRTKVKGLILDGKEYNVNRKVADVPLGKNIVPNDIHGAMQCLSMQNQLNDISGKLNEISEVCSLNFGRVIQGQRDDRLAKLLSSRSAFVQALSVLDKDLQKQMLIQSILNANDARAELAYQIKSDILELSNNSSIKVADMDRLVRDINTAIITINNAVQISLYAYQSLGEKHAQLSLIKDFETFVKQVLLKEIESNGNMHLAWEIIKSSSSKQMVPSYFNELPYKLLDTFETFIELSNSEKYYLEDTEYEE